MVKQHDTHDESAPTPGSSSARQLQTPIEAALQTHKYESLGRLTRGIVHDLNNLLTAISGNAELALHMAPPAEVAECLDEIHDAAARAGRLTTQIRAYAGQEIEQVGPQDLHEHLRAMEPLLQAIGSKRVALERLYAEDKAVIRIDEAQLHQLIVALVANAFEAIGETSGRITLRTRREALDKTQLADLRMGPDLDEGDYWILDVIDTGEGIEPEALGRLFDPSYTTKSVGRGMGLAVVEAILRSHRGAIGVESTSGKGSRFTVCLPAAE